MWEAMKQRFRHYLSYVLLGSGLVAAGCSDDDDPSPGLGGSGGSSTAGAAGSSGSGGRAGSAGAAGSSAGSGGSSAGSAGSAGAAGAAGSGAGAGGSAGETPDAGDDGGALAFSVSSPAFDNQPGCGPDPADRDECALFPDENTGLTGAEDVSPAINWTEAPAGTQSFAIVLQDLVFIQNGSPFTHWAMWNIPASATGLPAELPQGVMPGVPAANTQQYSFRDTRGYTGSGQCGNVYEFVLYALSTTTFTPPDAQNQNSVRDALNASDDVIATATMRGRSDPARQPCT
jgi:Raf kinase inhibitor-like YbhB/YbcL family protein